MAADTGKRNTNWIKKGILVLIVVCMAIFTFSQQQLFYIEKKYSVGNWEDDGNKLDNIEAEISVLGNQVVEQQFIAKESELINVAIDFKAWEQKNGKGSILVEIQDMSGTVLASAEKKVPALRQSKEGVTTTFGVRTPLEKGETY